MVAKLSKIIRERDVDEFCGLKRTQRKELIKAEKFPRPIRLSARAVGYLESELLEWQQARIAERDNA
jgi:prophage regulatory protein